MIQRIQTLLLFLVIPVNVAFVFTPMFSHAMLDPGGWLSNALVAALLFSALLSVYAIFLFRDRGRQIHWIYRAALFQVIALGALAGIFFTVGRLGSHLMAEVLSTGLVAFGLLLQYAAIYFVKKDEALVKSMDRIR